MRVGREAPSENLKYEKFESARPGYAISEAVLWKVLVT